MAVYIVLRMIRALLPRAVAAFLLRHSIIIRPGIERTDPRKAADQYESIVTRQGRVLKDSTVMIFGYGGYLGTAVELLRRGTAHVVVYDKFALPDHKRNHLLFLENKRYCLEAGADLVPAPRYITVFPCQHFDVQMEIFKNKVDYIFSNSVLEHVENVEETLRTLSLLTNERGIQIHFVDLRDHFSCYPFHMLCFSEQVWRNYFNPSTNLNRLRGFHYQRIIQRYFSEGEVRILASDIPAFEKIKKKIRPEFKSGDSAIDSATGIVLITKGGRKR